MDAMNGQLARKTVKLYRCSNCWGELESLPDLTGKLDSFFVTCKKCKEETKGYVTEHFVKQRQSDSAFEAREVTRMMKKVGVLPSEKRSSSEILKQMGF